MIGATSRRGMSGGAIAQAEPAYMRLRLIGQMEAWTLTSENVLPTGRKTRALLAILALSAPRPVLRGKLAELLWSRRPEEQARASLRQEIHRLTEAMSPIGPQVLAVNRDHLLLRPSSVWTDVEEVLRATPARPAALALLDGVLLEDLDGIDPAFDIWLAAERERLTDRARVLAEHLLRETSDPEAIIAAAQQLLAIDRAHEGAWRALMRAYAGGGERGMAIQAYERCRAALADQLDANPSEETQRLAAEIRAAAPVLRPSAGFASAATARADLRFADQRVADPRPPPRAEPRPDVRADGRPEARPSPSRGAPRVGVLPLQPIGSGEAEVQLATGLADEITAELARFRWMSLVSAGSLARIAAQTRDEAAIRRAANIDFLLDGTIQRVPERLRVALRLLDLRAGNQVVWSHRFDRDVTDLLTLQDDVAAEVAARIDAEIRLIEAQRAATRPAGDATAYDLVLRAFPLMSRLDRAQFMQAGDLLRRAIAQEPDNPAAHAWLACWHIVLFLQAWSGDPAAVVIEAARLATRAVMLDPQDARSLTIAGHVRAVLNRRPREALSLHERALTLNPNLGMAWAFSGAAFACLGELAEAERRMRRYKALSPLDPHACFHDVVFVLIALLRRDHEAAVATGREVSEMNPAYATAYKPYLAALGHLGHADEAALVRQRLLAVEPGFTIARFFAASPLARAEDRDHCAAGLRLANVAEA